MISNDYPIDFVIPWVDGSDPAWQEEKRKYSPVYVDDSNSVNRYRDWGLLPYWFRAVERFTPWVHKIHFITWGHLPDFLNREHPKLHIVRHEDYIPREYLPTFSANPIEMNMHRIEGLSEHFVYFNDDTFIMRPMEKKQFFKKGLPCIYGVESPVVPANREVWQYLLVNDVITINQHFSKNRMTFATTMKMLSGKYSLTEHIRAIATKCLFPNDFVGFKNVHAPASFLKSTFKTIWQEENELLKNTTSHRFRSKEDVNQWLALWWQVVSGQFEPYKTDSVISVADEAHIEKLCKIIQNQSHDMLCINDPVGDIDFIVLSEKLKMAFETILSEKCSFEK